MKTYLNNIVVIFLVLFVGLNTLKGAEMENIESVSIIELIANSDKYHNKKIRVVGFLNLDFESKALYLSSSDYEHSITKNAIWVSVDKSGEYKKFNKQYVLVDGVFDAESKGHLKLYSGTIMDVDRVISWGEKIE